MESQYYRVHNGMGNALGLSTTGYLIEWGMLWVSILLST